MSLLPPGWSKTRLLLSGIGPSFTVQLRNPINKVVFATVVSIQNCNGILQVTGLNTCSLSTVDASGNLYQFDYLGSGINGELAYSLFNPPVIPNGPQTGKNLTQVAINFVDVYGNSFSLSHGTVVSVELDMWSYEDPHHR